MSKSDKPAEKNPQGRNTNVSANTSAPQRTRTNTIATELTAAEKEALRGLGIRTKEDRKQAVATQQTAPQLNRTQSLVNFLYERGNNTSMSEKDIKEAHAVLSNSSKPTFQKQQSLVSLIHDGAGQKEIEQFHIRQSERNRANTVTSPSNPKITPPTPTPKGTSPKPGKPQGPITTPPK